MKPHPTPQRFRKSMWGVKWGGLALTVLLAVLWIGSGWWFIEWASPMWDRVTVGVSGGHLYVSAGEEIILNGDAFGFGTGRSHGWRLWSPMFAWTSFTQCEAEIPLVVPISAAAIATFAALRLDTLARRRATLNLCPNCNYDRTGLRDGASGPCPECGTSPATAEA